MIWTYKITESKDGQIRQLDKIDKFRQINENQIWVMHLLT